MVKFYKKYFERLARQNRFIEHTDEAPSFFYVKDKYSPKAFDDALRSVAKTPAFLLERYSFDLTDNTNNNYFRHINGRFTIVTGTISGDQESIEAAEHLAEQIAISFLTKMRKDLEGGGIITIDSGEEQKVFFTFRELPIDPVGPMFQKYYGVTVGFEWRCPLIGGVSPGDWLDN